MAFSGVATGLGHCEGLLSSTWPVKDLRQVGAPRLPEGSQRLLSTSSSSDIHRHYLSSSPETPPPGPPLLRHTPLSH